MCHFLGLVSIYGLSDKVKLRMTKIALTKSGSSFEGVLKNLAGLKDDIREKIKDKKNVVIKVNFVSSFNKLAATDVDSVRAVLEFLRPIYGLKIKIVEVGTIGGAELGFARYGYRKLAKKYNVELVNLKKDGFTGVELIDSDGDKFMARFSKTMLDSDFVISVCRPKTHDTVVVTMGLKNVAVGGLEKGSVIHQGKFIHQNLVRIAKLCRPSLNIIDGTIGMEGNGPVSGKQIKSGWVTTSLDFLAADSLATYLMGINVIDVGYMMLAKEEDLGKLYPDDEIEIKGENQDELKLKFKLHDSFERQRKWR